MTYERRGTGAHGPAALPPSPSPSTYLDPPHTTPSQRTAPRPPSLLEPGRWLGLSPAVGQAAAAGQAVAGMAVAGATSRRASTAGMGKVRMGWGGPGSAGEGKPGRGLVNR